MEVVNCIPTYMPIRMFINILFIKVKGTENNTIVHYYKKNRHIHSVVFTQEYYIAVKKNKLQLNVVTPYFPQEHNVKQQDRLQEICTE